MLSKKILGLLIAASALAPLTTAIVEAIDPECVQAATEFIPADTPLKVDTTSALYAIPPYILHAGDVNDDGKTDISDYTLLKKYLETDGNVIINEDYADVTHDGRVTFLDLLKLKTLI